MCKMGKNNILLILTNTFPFGKKETYLENEISHIHGFDRVLIISCFPEDNITRGCIGFETIAINSKSNKLNNIISVLFDGDFWKELGLILKKRKNKIKCTKKLIWFSIRGKNLEDNINNIVNDLCINDSTLYLYSYWMVESAYAAAKIKKKFNNVVFVTRCHGYDLYEYRNLIEYIPYRELIFKYANRVFPVSQDGKAYLKNKYNLYNNVKTMYLGTINEQEPNMIIPHRGILRIVSCSNTVLVKRIDRIIDALKEIKDLRIEWHHFGDGELFGELQKYAINKLDGKENISYKFCGRKSNREILTQYYLNNYDLFINVSESEGLPVSIMEAMSCAIPAVATNVGGTSELVLDNVNGFLLNADFSLDEFKECLSCYSKLPFSKKIEMKKAAYKKWAVDFNANRNYESFYNEILKCE